MTGHGAQLRSSPQSQTGVLPAGPALCLTTDPDAGGFLRAVQLLLTAGLHPDSLSFRRTNSGVCAVVHISFPRDSDTQRLAVVARKIQQIPSVHGVHTLDDDSF